MDIIPFDQNYLPQASALFTNGFKELRRIVPALPCAMEESHIVTRMQGDEFGPTNGLMAVKDGRLAGYLAWFLVEGFRGTPRKAAYVPEWGHACTEDDKASIYRRLYRVAGEIWAGAGCHVHAISLLANDRSAESAWYWNGFGLLVVDAVRSMLPLNPRGSEPLHVRKAAFGDAYLLAKLDMEHWEHYTRSPVFMPARKGLDAEGNTTFLAQPSNRVWLAFDGETPAGFLRFDGSDFDGVAITAAEGTVQITGAYLRPAYRGLGAAEALLDSALRDYQSAGFTRCAVNFESFNPEAAGFWMKYFTPVAHSLARVPET